MKLSCCRSLHGSNYLSRRLFKVLTWCGLLFCSSALSGQTIDDGAMIPRNTVFTGALYTHDSWDHYWEGPLNRVNGNLGTVTTQTTALTGNYGVLDRLNILATIPYVWTSASQGVLSGMEGWQDVTLAAKYRIINKSLRDSGSLTVFGVAYGGLPLTDYQPDFQPLSIGLGSARIGARSTVNFQSKRGWFLNNTAAYTWRKDVTIDAPYYFTNNQLFLTDDVKMPDVVDYAISPGYQRKGLMAQFTFSKVITQGSANSGDIRRQDFPFISNRVISSKVGGVVMYPLPIRRLRSTSFRLEYSHVVDGRNVGQSNTVTIGLLETLSFKRRTP
jgi:hypothetical protein